MGLKIIFLGILKVIFVTANFSADVTSTSTPAINEPASNSTSFGRVCDDICCKCNWLSSLKWFGLKFAWMLLYALAAAFLVAAGILAIVNIIGCRPLGVGGGSLAASIMSMIGNVPAGSLFAIGQSLGATGLWTSMFGPIGWVSAIAACVVYWYCVISGVQFAPLPSFVDVCKTDCGCCNFLPTPNITLPFL